MNYMYVQNISLVVAVQAMFMFMTYVSPIIVSLNFSIIQWRYVDSSGHLMADILPLVEMTILCVYGALALVRMR